MGFRGFADCLAEDFDRAAAAATEVGVLALPALLTDLIIGFEGTVPIRFGLCQIEHVIAGHLRGAMHFGLARRLGFRGLDNQRGGRLDVGDECARPSGNCSVHIFLLCFVCTLEKFKNLTNW